MHCLTNLHVSPLENLTVLTGTVLTSHIQSLEMKTNDWLVFVTSMHFYVCRYKQLLQRKGELEDLEKNLKEQQEKMALENQTHQATADQCKLLKEENDRSALV